MSLKKQALSGLLWTFIDAFVIKGLSFVSSIVLARLLGPTEFGLIGMVAIFIAIGTSLVDSGLSSSLIRTKEATDEDFSTVFYLNLVISFLVYIFFFFTAPYISSFYGQGILTIIIRLYCITFITSAFSAVHLAILSRQMKFKKIMLLNIPGTVIGATLGIWMGKHGYGVWSIVYMYIMTQFVQSLMLWIFSRWKPSWTFSKKKMRYHYKFGYKLMLSGLLDTGFRNIYNVLIGKYYSVNSLGYYERARSLNDYPVSILTNVILRVSYPLLAQIQDQHERLASVYRQQLQFAFFISAPLMLGAATIAEPLFLLVLGEQWISAVPFFQILCFAGMLFPIHALNINVLKIFGRSDLFLKLEVLKKITIVICVVIFFKFGIVGLVWSSVLSSIISLVINTRYSSKLIHYKTSSQFIDMIPTLLISIAMSLGMMGILLLLKGSNLFLQIIVSALVGITIFLFINFVFKTNTWKLSLNLLIRRAT